MSKATLDKRTMGDEEDYVQKAKNLLKSYIERGNEINRLSDEIEALKEATRKMDMSRLLNCKCCYAIDVVDVEELRKLADK